MHIHQMSVTFLPEHDRILVRVNTTEGEEMRLWLTRRLMAGLWPLLTKMLTAHLLKLESAGATLEASDEALRKMLADFRKEEFLQHADFDTPFQDGQSRLPLGEEPLLVTDVDATPLPAGPLQLSFNERSVGGHAEPRSFRIEMEPRLMQGLMHLLEQALVQSQWREPFAPAAEPAEHASPDEADATPRRPRYLN
jgi:hypothetical protein